MKSWATVVTHRNLWYALALFTFPCFLSRAEANAAKLKYSIFSIVEISKGTSFASMLDYRRWFSLEPTPDSNAKLIGAYCLANA